MNLKGTLSSSRTIYYRFQGGGFETHDHVCPLDENNPDVLYVVTVTWHGDRSTRVGSRDHLLQF